MEVSFATNHTGQTLGALSRGDGMQALAFGRELFRTSGVVLDQNATMLKMLQKLTNCPYVDTPRVLPKAVVVDVIPTRDAGRRSPSPALAHSRSCINLREMAEMTVRENTPPVQDHTTLIKMHGDIAQDAFAVGSLKKKQPGSALIDLNRLSNAQIFEGAMQVAHPMGQISFSNVQFGGAFPDLGLECDLDFQQMIGKEQRIQFLQEVLDKYAIRIPSDLSTLNAPALIQEIATFVREMPLASNEQLSLIEKITRDVVSALVGQAKFINSDLYQFDEQVPLGRDYFPHGQRGISATTLFARHEANHGNGRISLNMFIKEGGADCRGANTLYAVLLNTGFKALGAASEARLLYTQIAMDSNADSFAASKPADHNVVIVCDPSKKGQEQYRIMDARWHNNDGHALRKVLQGTVDSEGIAIQIVGATRYPKEQSGLIKAEKYARIKRYGKVAVGALGLLATALLGAAAMAV